MNTVIIAALFLVFTSYMMQMNGVEAAKNNSNNRKLRGADNNNNEVDEQVVPVNDGDHRSVCANMGCSCG